MLLNPTPVQSNLFSFNTNTFISNFSTLGPYFRFGLVYDDACDEGFTVVSSRTGKKAVFAYDRNDVSDGEVTGYRFVCVSDGLTNLRALITNT